MGMPLYGDAEGNFQAKLQLVFLVVALLCALLILLPKPLILISRHKKVAEPHPRSTLKESEGQLHKKLLEEHDDEEVIASYFFSFIIKLFKGKRSFYQRNRQSKEGVDPEKR